MTFFPGKPVSKNDSQVRHRAEHRRRRLRFETLEQRFLMAVGRYEALSNILDQYFALYDAKPDSFESQQAFLDTVAPYRLARALAQGLAITEKTDSSQSLNEPYRSEVIAEIDALLESARPLLDSRALTTADSSKETVASSPTSIEIKRLETMSASEPLVAFQFEPPALPPESSDLPSRSATLPRGAEPIPDERTSTAASQQLDAIETNKSELTNTTESDSADNPKNGVESNVGSNPKQVDSAFIVTLRNSSTSSREIDTSNRFLNNTSDFASVRQFFRGQSDSIKASDLGDRHSSDISEQETSIPQFKEQRSDDRTAIARPRKSEHSSNKERDPEPLAVIDRLLDELAFKNPTLDFSLGKPDWEVRYHRVPLSLFQAFDAKSSIAYGPFVACDYELWPEEHFKPQDRLAQRVDVDKQFVEYGYRHMQMQLIEDDCDGMSEHQGLAQERSEAPISNEISHSTSSFLSGWSSQSWSYVAVLLATLTTLARRRRTRKEGNSSFDRLQPDHRLEAVASASAKAIELLGGSPVMSCELDSAIGKTAGANETERNHSVLRMRFVGAGLLTLGVIIAITNPRW